MSGVALWRKICSVVLAHFYDDFVQWIYRALR